MEESDAKDPIAHAQAVASMAEDFYTSSKEFIRNVISASVHHMAVLNGRVDGRMTNEFRLGSYLVKIEERAAQFRDSDDRVISVYRFVLSYRMPKKWLLGTCQYDRPLLWDNFYFKETGGDIGLFKCLAFTDNVFDLDNFSYIQGYLEALKEAEMPLINEVLKGIVS